MKTKVLTADQIEEAVEDLKRGEPVVFPTETVYGIGASVFDETSILKIFAIKGRPLDNPLIVHIADLEEVKKLSSEIPEKFYRLVNVFWPGPLTLVLKRGEGVPSVVSAGHPTVAIRMPSHPIARELIRKVGAPLVAPSANISGKPSPTNVQDVLEDLEGKVHFVIDGGECEVGIESTVLSLLDQPKILRPGKIRKEEIESVLGSKVVYAESQDQVISPGMKYRHYAPKAKLKLIFDKRDVEGGYLIFPKANTFYRQLREADRKGVQLIEVFCDEEVINNVGLMNRLLRASGQIG